jgi:hypothetical protein
MNSSITCTLVRVQIVMPNDERERAAQQELDAVKEQMRYAFQCAAVLAHNLLT